MMIIVSVQSKYLLLLSSVENDSQLIGVSSNDLSDPERRDARSQIFPVDVHNYVHTA